jgi:hypothetical protein
LVPANVFAFVCYFVAEKSSNPQMTIRPER